MKQKSVCSDVGRLSSMHDGRCTELVRSVGLGAVLVEKVGGRSGLCVCAEEHRSLGATCRWPALTLLMDVRPCQHSFASCKKLLIILDLCEEGPVAVGGLWWPVCVLCVCCAYVRRVCVCVCGVHYRRRGSGHVGLAHAQRRRATWGWCF